MGREISLGFLQQDVTRQLTVGRTLLSVSEKLAAIERGIDDPQLKTRLREQINVLLQNSDLLMQNAAETGRSAARIR